MSAPSSTSENWIEGGELLARTLRAAGVDTVFALHGGHLESFYRGCFNNEIHLVDFRHGATGAGRLWRGAVATQRGAAPCRIREPQNADLRCPVEGLAHPCQLPHRSHLVDGRDGREVGDGFSRSRRRQHQKGTRGDTD